MAREAPKELRKALRGRTPQGAAGVLACAILGSSGLVTLVLATASGPGTRLGAPEYWAWVLTGLQVTALWVAGAGHPWGWPLGAAVQPAWIAYALVTGQVGFIPGCVVSGAVQTANFLRLAKKLPSDDAADPPAPAILRAVQPQPLVDTRRPLSLGSHDDRTSGKGAGANG